MRARLSLSRLGRLLAIVAVAGALWTAPVLLDGRLLLLVEVRVDLDPALLEEHRRVVLTIDEGGKIGRPPALCPGASP